MKKVIYSSSAPMDAVVLTLQQAHKEVEHCITGEELLTTPDNKVIAKATAILKELEALINTYKKHWNQRDFFELSPRAKVLIIEGMLRDPSSLSKLSNTKKAKLYSSLFRIGVHATRVNLSSTNWTDEERKEIEKFFKEHIDTQYMPIE